MAQAFLLLISVILAITLVFLVVRYLNDRAQIREEAFASATTQAVQAADELSQVFSGAMAIGEDIAADLSSGALPYQEVEVRLRQTMETWPAIDGITVAFAPQAYAPDQRLYALFLYRDGEEQLVFEEGEPPYDYTLPLDEDSEGPSTSWYTDRVAEGASWSEPFPDPDIGKALIQYGVPFYASDPGAQEPVVAGVVAVDFSLENMRILVEALDLGETGYGGVFNRSGTWLAHPVPEMIATSTISDAVQAQQDPTLLVAAERAIAGEAVSVTRREPESGVNVWDFFTPIESTGWVLVVELDQVEYLPHPQVILQRVSEILLVAGALLFFLLALAFRVYQGEPSRLWAVSLAFSAISLALIVALIVLSFRTPQQRGVTVANRSTLNSYLENLGDAYLERGLAPPIEIPSGVLIQSTRFPDSSSVVVNGYVWQRVPRVEGQDVAAGFTLPEMIDEPFATEEIYREERENETYVIWSLLAALHQSFDTTEYPFDRNDISIRLAPTELQKNALLVPDLEAYTRTAPTFLPGLEGGLTIRNWTILSSAYRFELQQFNTNLGLPGRPTADVPELSFNIRTQRRFLGPFIAFLLPALVAAAMIFAFLLNEAKPDEPEEIVTALSYTAALFFVIAIMHTALRDDAAAIGLTYLEYFYLLLYLMIILVAINTFIVVRRPHSWLVRFGNNLVFKLLFWPLVLLVMLVATLVIFVYG